MRDGRLVELPVGWVLPGDKTARHVTVHGALTFRAVDGGVQVVAACGIVEGCSPPFTVEETATAGSSLGSLPGIATHAAEQLVDHLTHHHGIIRPNVGLVHAPNLYRDATDYGRELVP